VGSRWSDLHLFNSSALVLSHAEVARQRGKNAVPPMTASDLQTLLSRSFEDPELEAQLKAQDADPVAVAASVGLHITAQEFAKAQESWETWRMSSVHDEEF
jgi:hypothetical protein